MTIDVKGTVTHVGEPQVVSEKFTKLEFVIQTESGQYPKHVCFQASSKKVDDAKKLKIGDVVELKAGVNCREYNGKFYNTIEAFFIKVVSKGSAMQPNEGFETSKNDDSEDSLPF